MLPDLDHEPDASLRPKLPPAHRNLNSYVHRRNLSQETGFLRVRPIYRVASHSTK